MTVDLEAAAANQLEEEEEEEDGEEAAAARDEDSDGESSRTQQSIPESKPVCLCQQFQHNTFLRKLEAEAKVQFDWWTFYKELVYHMFFPLTLPLLYLFEGGAFSIRNRMYWGSRTALSQWVLAICFFAMNLLTPFYVSPDIVITNILAVMRTMVIATKYGFYSKSDMAEMRVKLIPLDVQRDRTLFLAWLNPIPLQVLKRQLLLSAIRNNFAKCTAALRLVPGASRNTVGDIMHQLSNDKRSISQRRARSAAQRGEVQSKDCPRCVQTHCTERQLEDRWIQVCMSQIHRDPSCHLPKSMEASSVGSPERTAEAPEEDNMDTSQNGNETNFRHLEEEKLSLEKNMVPEEAVDLPALLLAAYLLQHTGDLLSKKQLWHQLWKNPVRTWGAAVCVATVHSAIPFACRAIAGQPSTWGGDSVYATIVSLSSILLNLYSMSMCVSFMLAGVADFRRRYFAARILNNLLKDGCWWNFKLPAEDSEEKTYVQRKLLEEGDSEYHLGVTIDFGKASSIVGWWVMRVLVLDFGLVFSKRVKYYATYFALYCGLLMAFLVIELFAKGTRASSYILGVVSFDLVVFIGLLALIIFPGGETNEMHIEHSATLVYKKMELFTKLRGPVENLTAIEQEQPLFALEVINTISEALDWDKTITQVTMLGFHAGSEVIGVLLGVAGAAIGIIAQQLTSHL